MGLADGLKYLLDFERPALVFDADADALAKDMAQHTRLTVHLVDFRNGACPPLDERMAEIRDKKGIALIAFDASPDRRFSVLLGDLLQRQGWVNQHLHGSGVLLVVSTSAKALDRIDSWQSIEETLRKLTWVNDGGLTPNS